VLESEKALLVEDTTRFGVALYQKVAARPGNILFSPLGISSALALLDAGARGRTAKQMEKTLGWKLSASGSVPLTRCCSQAPSAEDSSTRVA